MPVDANQRGKAVVDLPAGQRELEDPDEGKDQAAVEATRSGGLEAGRHGPANATAFNEGRGPCCLGVASLPAPQLGPAHKTLTKRYGGKTTPRWPRARPIMSGRSGVWSDWEIAGLLD